MIETVVQKAEGTVMVPVAHATVIPGTNPVAATLDSSPAAATPVTSQVVQERCTKQSVPTASRRLRFLSSLPVTDLYIAGNVCKITDLQRDLPDTKYPR